MSELITLFKDASPALILVVVVAYFARKYFEGLIQNRFSSLEQVMKSTLSIRERLRDNEQRELVEFRVAVERWEYFLQTGIAEITMRSEGSGFEPADFHRRDVELFGAVREAAVKASIYLRDAAMETELLQAITTVRGLYYPLLAGTMQRLLATQEQMLPLLARMKQFEASGQRDTSVALNAEEAGHLIELRHAMTAELRAYVDGLVANYRPIAEQLHALKERMNVHIYRPAAVG